jgi:hypothetical protein
MTQTEQDIIRSLGRIEGRFQGVEDKLEEIHSLTERVNRLENKNSKLYGALTLLGLLWTTAAALLLKAFK